MTSFSIILTAGCAILAAVFALYYPKQDIVATRDDWRALAVRWLHSVVWVLLAIYFATRATGLARSGDFAGLVAVIAYIVFIYALTTLEDNSDSEIDMKDKNV